MRRTWASSYCEGPCWDPMACQRVKRCDEYEEEVVPRITYAAAANPTPDKRLHCSKFAHPCEPILWLELLGCHQGVVDHAEASASPTAECHFESIQQNAAWVLNLQVSMHMVRRPALYHGLLVCTLYIFASFSCRSFLETPASPG